MSLTVFEHTFPASERLHTLALDRAASESRLILNQLFKVSNSVFKIFDIIFGKYYSEQFSSNVFLYFPRIVFELSVM